MAGPGGTGGAGGGGSRSGGRPTPGATKESLAITQQMSVLINQMATSSDRIAKSFESQAAATAEMSENMKGMGTGEVVNQLIQVNATLKEVAASLANLNQTSSATFAALSEGALLAASSTDKLSDASKKAAEAAAKETTSLQDLQEKLGKTGKNAMSARDKIKAVGEYLEKDFPVATGAALGALSGLQQGFSNITSLGSGILGFASSVGSALFDIGKSIISIPFKLFDGLVNMAKKGGGISELATALNNIRKEFGALSGPVASSIQSAAREMKGFSGAGVSAFQVFGTVAERMELLTKLFSAGGVALQSFSKEFKDNGGAILGFQKGLGITDEQMGVLAQTAKATGTSVTDQLMDITKQADHLGKAFNLDVKIISKGMAKATTDIAHFGSMSKAQVGAAVTYFTKLGVEVDKVTGAMDAFSTFDEAADKVSTLNQVMGTNLDAMKLTNAQDPAEVIEDLRKEFARAGIDGEKMTRQQRMMVKQLTNLDDAEQKLLFSSKNRGLSLAQVRKESEKAEKKTMTQTEAMAKLADSMDRVLKAGESKEGGFFDHFFQGFTDGLQRTREFQELMMNIRGALREVYLAGVRLGKAFVEFFPGVKDFLGGLSDIFKPEKFRKLANGVTDIFIGFFKDLESGKASFPDLMERLKKKFFDFFDSEKGAGQKLMGGFKKIMMAIQVILAGGIKWIMETMAGFIKDIVNFIKDPTGVPGVGKLADAADAYVSPIAQAFKDGWKELGPALEELFGLMFDKLGNIISSRLKPWAKENWPILAAILFGPAAAQALLGAGTALLTKSIGGMISKAFGSKDVQSQMLDQMKGINKKLAGAPGASQTGLPNVTADDNKKLDNMAQGGSKIKWSDVGKFLVGFAGVIAIGLVAFWVASKMVESMSMETITKALFVMGGVALAALPVAGTMMILSNMPQPNWKDLGLSLLALGVTMVALAGIGWLVVKIVGGLDFAAVATAMFLLGSMATIAVILSVAIISFAVVGLVLQAAAGQAVLGLVAVAVVGVALAAMGYGLVKAVGGLPLGQVASAFGVMGGVIAAAWSITKLIPGFAAVGATIILTVGPVLLALGAIGTILAAFAKMADVIVEKASKLPEDIGPKVDSIVKILDSLTNIAKIIPEMLKGLDFGFFESSAKQQEKIAKVTEMIEALFGKPGGSGLIGLIDKILSAVTAIGSDSKALEAAQSLGGILQGAAGIASAMASVGSMSEAFKNIDDDDFEKLTPIINGMGTFVEKIGTGLASIISSIGPLISAAAEIPKENAQSIQALASVMQAIGPIAQALVPPGLSELFSKIDDDDFEKVPGILDSMGRFTDKMSEQLTKKGGILEVMMGGLRDVISELKGLNMTPNDVEALKVLGPLLGEVIKVTSEISKNVTGAMAKDFDAGKGFQMARVLDSMGKVIEVMFEAMKDALPKMVEGVKSALTSLKSVNPQELKTGIDAINKVFGVIKEIPVLMNSLLNISKDKKFDTSGEWELSTMINSVATFFWRIAEAGTGGWGGQAPLKRLAGYMKSQAITDLASAGSGLNAVKSAFEMIKSIVESTRIIAGSGAEELHDYQLAVQIDNVATFFWRILEAGVDSSKWGGTAPLTRLTGYLGSNTITELAAKKSSMSSLKDSFSALSTLMGILPTVAGAEFDEWKLAVQINDVATFFWRVVEVGTGGWNGEGPLKRLVGYLGNTIWATAAGIDFEKPKAFLGKLKSIIDMMKGLSGGAVDIKTAQAEGLKMAAGVESVAMMIAYLIDPAWYQQAGGVGRPPAVYLSDALASNWPKTENIAASVPKVTAFMNSVSALQKPLAAFPIQVNDFKASQDQGKKLAAGVDAVAWGIGTLVDTNLYKYSGGIGDDAPVVAMLKYSDSFNELEAFDAMANKVQKFMGSVKKVAIGFDDVSSKLKVSTQNAYGPIAKAIGDMMKAVVDVDRAISGAQTVNLKASLDKFKANFGAAFGGSGSHVVQTKPLNLTVNFTVAIDATKLEGAIIQHGKVIKDSINLISEAVGEHDARYERKKAETTKSGEKPAAAAAVTAAVNKAMDLLASTGTSAHDKVNYRTDRGQHGILTDK